jgi:hypothetical protein
VSLRAVMLELGIMVAASAICSGSERGVSMACSTQCHLPCACHWMELGVSCLPDDKVHVTGFGDSLMGPSQDCREGGKMGRTSQPYFSVDPVKCAV